MRKLLALTVAASSLLASCSKAGPVVQSAQDGGYQKQLIERLIDAKPGEVIEIPAGKFQFDRSLSLRVSGVTLRGAGSDKTVLSFKGQKSGAEGLLVNASDFTLENLAIEDSKGDGLKSSRAATSPSAACAWSGPAGPKDTNGAYGIYPVKTHDTLIENCVVIGASDAGIYVGQSKNIVMRGNRVEFNVGRHRGRELDRRRRLRQHRHQQHRRHPGVQHAEHHPGRATAPACTATRCSRTTPATSPPRARPWPACRPARAW
jgi:parallel beta-helix repeat protein